MAAKKHAFAKLDLEQTREKGESAEEWKERVMREFGLTEAEFDERSRHFTSQPDEVGVADDGVFEI